MVDRLVSERDALMRLVHARSAHVPPATGEALRHGRIGWQSLMVRWIEDRTLIGVAATIRSDAGGDGSAVGSVRWWQQQWPFSAWTGLAPQQLTQPINPGWSFGNLVTVTNVNSSAPEVERDVLARHSYGRQLGKLIDAVTALA